MLQVLHSILTPPRRNSRIHHGPVAKEEKGKKNREKKTRLTETGALSASSAKDTEKKKRKERERRRRDECSESVCMQVVLDPWVHKSSSIKCQPVLLCFSPSSPHWCDSWDKVKTFSSALWVLIPFTLCCHSLFVAIFPGKDRKVRRSWEYAWHQWIQRSLGGIGLTATV